MQHSYAASLASYNDSCRYYDEFSIRIYRESTEPIPMSVSCESVTVGEKRTQSVWLANVDESLSHSDPT